MSFCKGLRRRFQKISEEDELELQALEQGEKKKTSHYEVFAALLPFLWPKGEILIKVCVVVAMALMLFSKLCTVTVPIAYKHAVDDLSGDPLVFPVSWILVYTLLRWLSQLLADGRDTVFMVVSQNALKATAMRTFEHLHDLSLRFHLHRKTGTVLQAIERGTQRISFLLTFCLFNILPIILEIFMVCAIMLYLYSVWFAVITGATMVLYFSFTIGVTEWRTKFRRIMNELDNESNNKAIDSLINFETVKYFSNEHHEVSRYGNAIQGYTKAAIKSQNSMMLLNVGQAFIIALGVGGVMLLAGKEVVDGIMTVGDFVLVNTYLLQLYIPLNFLGTSYRMIKASLTDLENMFALMKEDIEVKDEAFAPPLQVPRGTIKFDHVTFKYDANDETPILDDVSFTIPEGHVLAVVGPTGAGKSTVSRLLFRFYDPQSGSITIDGQDIRSVAQRSLRANIGVVPQDTVLFNDTIRYNIAYGRPGLVASDDEVRQAASLAQIHEFITRIPEGYETVVGERGLRLSGGEKQRVAIARAILKNPKIMVFDEATSALDTKTEREIQTAFNQVCKGRTSLIIAHRLSTVIDADEIIVLKSGKIVERGNHAHLLSLRGEYFTMWNQQQESAHDSSSDSSSSSSSSSSSIEADSFFASPPAFHH